jgi:hypothetical protein
MPVTANCTALMTNGSASGAAHPMICTWKLHASAQASTHRSPRFMETSSSPRDGS